MSQNEADKIIGACVDLAKLLLSVPKSISSIRYYQSVKSIERSAATATMEELAQRWNELYELKDQLKFADADDGQKILNPRRYDGCSVGASGKNPMFRNLGFF